MDSNLDIEGFLAQMSINLAFTRVSDIFKASTSFSCCETFSAPKGARKCLSPTKYFCLSIAIILHLVAELLKEQH